MLFLHVKKCQRGFTLIELLLYISMAVLMLAFLGGIGVHVLSSRVKAHAQEELLYNAQFITQKLQGEISSASAITLPVQGATGVILSLVQNDTEGTPLLFEVVDGRLRMQEGVSEPVFISTEDMVVESLEFANVTQEGGAPTVRMRLYLQAYNPQNRQEFSASSTFYMTASVEYTQ